MTTIIPEELSQFTLFSNLLEALTSGEHIPLENDPPWWQEGVIVEFSEADYYEYRDMLLPRYMNGPYFAFGEGSGPFVLFWQRGNSFFARHLSQAETERFSELSHSPLHP